LLGTHGNKGELSAVPFTSSPERLRSVIVNDVPLDVEHTWTHGDRLIFKFRGVDTISEAERLRGADVLIPIAERAEIPEGEYYQSDLVGCEVAGADGRVIGIVEGWQETGGTPLIEVRKPDGRELLVPFAKSIFARIDLDKKRIEVNLPEGLENLNR
jgi:16S rRNA processing protein RimM